MFDFLAQVNTVVSSGDAAGATTTAAASSGTYSYFCCYVFHVHKTSEKETEGNGGNEKQD